MQCGDGVTHLGAWHRAQGVVRLRALDLRIHVQHELLVIAVLLLEEEALTRRDLAAEDAAVDRLHLDCRGVQRHAL